METCPKCGKPADADASTCAFCGVILAKARATARSGGVPPAVQPPARDEAPGPRPTPEGVSAFVTRQSEVQATSPTKAMLKVAAAAGLAALAFLALNQPSATPERPKGPNPAVEIQQLPTQSLPIPVLPPVAPHQAALTAEDVSFLNSLSSRLQAPSGGPPTAEELRRLELILDGNSHDLQLKDFLFAAWLRRAAHDAQTGASTLAYASVEKLKALDPRQPQIYEIEAHARARQGDWAGAVEAARNYDSVAGEGDLTMSFNLAAALFQLNRKPEALTVLDRPVFRSCSSAVPSSAEQGVCASAAQMREALVGSPASDGGRTRAALSVDASKQQIQSERFDVRFDGENQSGVARDVLFVLDRAYVRLADIYYERPSRKIPVVLHSAQDYYTATGAPFWSGGVFSSHDGAIQIPVRGLPSTLPREMEDVLVHELSHAFVDEMSGGFAGRDTQEGLAQFMEGKRIEEELGPAELKRLAGSGGQSVMSFYMLSLAVWQQIVQSRGQGTVNELLKAMKEGGSEEAAFQKVFGQSGRAMRTDVLETFWRRYS